jgi:hypothetical protein
MGHYAYECQTTIAPRDFKSYWQRTTPAVRDGCTSVIMMYSDYASEKATASRESAIMKKIEKNVKDKYEKLHCPPSYTCVALDIGITGYRIVQKKNKIINHKRQEVEIAKDYKSKPAHIPAGGRLVEMHKYIISFDGRCYDPREHGYDYDQGFNL